MTGGTTDDGAVEADGEVREVPDHDRYGDGRTRDERYGDDPFWDDPYQGAPHTDDDLDTVLEGMILALDAEIAAVAAKGHTRTIRFASGVLLRARPGHCVYLLRTSGRVPRLEASRVTLGTSGRFMGAELLDAGERELVVAVPREIGDSVGSGHVDVDPTAVLEATKRRIEDVRAGDLTLDDTAVRRIFLPRSTGAAGTVATGPIDRDQRPAETTPPATAVDLDEYQEAAVVAATDEDLLFVWGPPGTGKTRTLGALAARLAHAGRRVLLTAHAHVAVDTAVIAALASGAPRLRRVGPPQLPEVPEDVVVDELRARQEALDFAPGSDAGNGEVVAATLSKVCTDDALVSTRFDHVLVDEASMASLPQVLVAVGLSPRTTVFGDVRQLPPVVTGRGEAVAHWLERDIFQTSGVTHAVDAGEPDPRLHLLRRQYRALPTIAAVTNALAYGGALLSAPSTEAHTAFTNASPLPGAPVVLVDTAAWQPVAVRPATSRCNPLSALVCAGIAAEAVGGRSDRTVGIATPYAEQARLLRALLEDAGADHAVEVATVHRFQGGERQMMIVDLCDGRPLRPPPFLAGDEGRRLLNVAISRSQSKLVVVADTSWLRGGVVGEVLGITGSHGVVTDEDHGDLYWLDFDAFIEDAVSSLAVADSYVLMRAPNLRAEILVDAVAGAASRAGRCSVVTDRSTTPEVLDRLRDAGVELAVVKSLHDRLLVVDGTVWVGNTLSPAARDGDALARTTSERFARRLVMVLGST